MKTVAVIEGFAGGPMHTRQFRKALSKAGFRIIKDRKQADIIIAHSAGIYSIPPDSKARLLMLIGPTYWPGERLVQRMFRHTKSSREYHVARFGWRFYLWKELLEVYYFFTRHRYMWLGIINNNRLVRLSELVNQKGRKTIIIRNAEDVYFGPGLKNILKHKDLKFVDLPGIHDDYATNPQPYIDLLLKNI